MDNSNKAAVSAAVVSGYLLGRTKKAKYAFALATYVAGRRFSLSPAKLAQEGLRHLKEHPHLADLRDKVTGELLTAARSAMTGSADRRFAAMAETLRERNSARHAADRDADDMDEPDEMNDEAFEDEDELKGEEGFANEEDEEDELPEEPEEPEEAPRLRTRHAPGHSRAQRSARRRAPHGDSADDAVDEDDEADDEGMAMPSARRAPARKPTARQAPAKHTAPPRKAAAKESAPAGKKAAQKRSPAQKAMPSGSPSQSNRRGR